MHANGTDSNAIHYGFWDELFKRFTGVVVMKQSWHREAGIVDATTKPSLEWLDKVADTHFFSIQPIIWPLLGRPRVSLSQTSRCRWISSAIKHSGSRADKEDDAEVVYGFYTTMHSWSGSDAQWYGLDQYGFDRYCYGKEFYCFLEFDVSMVTRSPAPLWWLRNDVINLVSVLAE